MALSPNDLSLRLSGGSGNADPAASLGGVASTSAEAPAGLIRDITYAERVAGITLYRCVYLRNASGSDSAAASVVWVESDTTSAQTDIALGIGASAVNGVEPAIATETTAPAGVTFGAASTKSAGVAVPALGPGETKALWIRLTVNAGAPAESVDAWSLRWALNVGAAVEAGAGASAAAGAAIATGIMVKAIIGASSSTSAATAASPTAGTGFATRPYLFQADASRLLASIAASDLEATGSSSNVNGSPLGFVTLCNAALANRPGNSDVPTWQLAVCGWLTNNSSMRSLAKTECMTMVNSQIPGGVSGHGDSYQHAEDVMAVAAITVDCCYAEFSAGERSTVASWINNTMTNWNSENSSFWPFSATANNYWQNGFLACVFAGICSEGWNASASTWRTQAETMGALVASQLNNPSNWDGPIASEGGYYSAYVSNMLWAMQLYDRVMGTTMEASSGIDVQEHLQMLMYFTRPDLTRYFEIGSEAAQADAGFTHVKFRWWYHLIASAPSTDEAKQAKALLAVAEPFGSNFFARLTKGFANFYHSIADVSSYTLSTKADRMLVLPTPGAGMVGLTTGWTTSARKALHFAHPSNSSPPYSHANPDAPGFQFCNAGDWIAADPEYFNSSGILAEAGSSVGGSVSNIVTIDSYSGVGYVDGSGVSPIITHAHDNTGASVPHYHIQIDAEPYWTAASIYRRDYVWLDDMQCCVIFDRVAASGAKTWRFHTPPSVSIASGAATFTSGSTACTLYDVFSSGGNAMTVANVSGISGTCRRISQSDSTTDARSLKVLGVNGRVTAATYSSGTGYHQANLTVNGASISVRCYDDGTVPLVS